MAVSIYLCQIWGAAVAALGTGMASILGHGLIMNVVYHKMINIDVWVFWKNILRQLLGMVPAFAVGVLMMQRLLIDSWLKMAGCVAIYSVSYLLSVLCLSLNQEERTFCKALLCKFYPRGEGK